MTRRFIPRRERERRVRQEQRTIELEALRIIVEGFGSSVIAARTRRSMVDGSRVWSFHAKSPVHERRMLIEQRRARGFPATFVPIWQPPAIRRRKKK